MKKYKYIDKDGKIYEFTKEEAIAARKMAGGTDTSDGWKYNVFVKGLGETKFLHRVLSPKKEKLYFEKLDEWNKFQEHICK